MRRGMSNIDIALFVKEAMVNINYATLDNVYQLDNGIFLFKMRKKGATFDLLFEPGRRIHLTSYKYNIPKTPPHFCRMLRRFIRRGIVERVYQQDMDRIVVLEIRKGDVLYKLFLEVFGDGNIILVDEENKIRLALRYKRMRDRNILIKETFSPPPKSTRLNIMEDDFEKFRELLRESKGDTVSRFLVLKLGIGKDYAEELCECSDVDMREKVDGLEDDEIRKLWDGILRIRESMKGGKLSPVVYLDGGKPISYSAFKLKIYDGYECKEFPSFNEALDHYFTHLSKEMVRDVVESEKEKRIKELRNIVVKQQRYMTELMRKMESYKKLGTILFQEIKKLDEARDVVKNGLKEGGDKGLILSRLKEIFEGSVLSPEYFDHKEIVFIVDGEKVKVPLKGSLGEFAGKYFEDVKKFESKVERIREIIKDAEDKIREVEEEILVEVEERRKRIRVKAKKKWYEKFRWFFSSEGILVLGGKDATSNEVLFKKYVESRDVVFHADVQGSPLVVLKGDAGKDTIEETAQFTASFSKAWKMGWGNVDVYWVYGDQISKTPPSGQYLKKGSFIIKGKRNFIKNVPLELAVGLYYDDGFKFMCGPPKAVSKWCKRFVRIRPGKEKKESVTKTILSFLSKDLKEQILDLDDLINVLPPGGLDIVSFSEDEGVERRGKDSSG
ncbi:MAG: ribosome rescue protein RqcH [Candidatus Asgardarchaeia archaeon]